MATTPEPPKKKNIYTLIEKSSIYLGREGGILAGIPAVAIGSATSFFVIAAGIAITKNPRLLSPLVTGAIKGIKGNDLIIETENPIHPLGYNPEISHDFSRILGRDVFIVIEEVDLEKIQDITNLPLPFEDVTVLETIANGNPIPKGKILDVAKNQNLFWLIIPILIDFALSRSEESNLETIFHLYSNAPEQVQKQIKRLLLVSGMIDWKVYEGKLELSNLSVRKREPIRKPYVESLLTEPIRRQSLDQSPETEIASVIGQISHYIQSGDKNDLKHARSNFERAEALVTLHGFTEKMSIQMEKLRSRLSQ